MNIDRVDIEASTRNSLLRARVLACLAVVGVAHAGELAELARTDTTTLRRVMHGDPPAWSVERAPVTLGLAVVVPHPSLEVYAITDAGRVWHAHQRLASRRARVAAAALP